MRGDCSRMKRTYFIPFFGFLGIGIAATAVALLWSDTTETANVAFGFGAVIAGAALTYTLGLQRIAACEDCRKYVPGAARKDRETHAAGHQSWRLFLPLMTFTAFVLVTGFAVAGLDAGRARAIVIACYSVTGVAGVMVYFLGQWAVITDLAASS